MFSYAVYPDNVVQGDRPRCFHLLTICKQPWFQELVFRQIKGRTTRRQWITSCHEYSATMQINHQEVEVPICTFLLMFDLVLPLSAARPVPAILHPVPCPRFAAGSSLRTSSHQQIGLVLPEQSESAVEGITFCRFGGLSALWLHLKLTVLRQKQDSTFLAWFSSETGAQSGHLDRKLPF